MTNDSSQPPTPVTSLTNSASTSSASPTATTTETTLSGPTVIVDLYPPQLLGGQPVAGTGSAVTVSTIGLTTSSTSTASSSTGASPTSSQSISAVRGSTSLTSGDQSSSTTSSTSIASANNPVNKSSNTGLIAGVAVLGALLALALGALIFLLLRRRRTKDRRGEYAPTFEPKSVQDSPTASLENTINSLETQLHERDIQLRESQAALLQRGRGVGGSSLDDRQVNERFSRLSKSINDWVLTHFKKMRPGVSPTRDVVAILQKSQPNYARLLGEPRTRYLVIRSLVAEILVQAFNTGELLGNPAFSELKQAIGVKSSTAEANDWRAQTMTLLEQSPSYQNDRASAVHEIGKKIDDMTSNLAGLGYSEARLNHLSQIIDAAAGLALDLAKQRALFKFIMGEPGVTDFDATTMEDALQDHKAENLQGRPIQSIVFPAVKRWGDDSGKGYERSHTVSKAQVLV